MLLVVNICLLICLFFIVVQDFKNREIAFFLILILFVGFVFTSLNVNSFDVFITDFIFNLCFILLQLALSTIYISVKNKKMVNIINTYTGIGDILFFLVMAAAFSPVNFVIFFTVSTALTVLVFGVLGLVKQISKEIPLAGSMASVMMAIMVWKFCYPCLNFHNDDYFISCYFKYFMFY